MLQCSKNVITFLKCYNPPSIATVVSANLGLVLVNILMSQIKCKLTQTADTLQLLAVNKPLTPYTVQALSDLQLQNM